jgi:hypothetical protein
MFLVPITVPDSSVVASVAIDAVAVAAGVTVATSGAFCSAAASASVRLRAGGPSEVGGLRHDGDVVGYRFDPRINRVAHP